MLQGLTERAGWLAAGRILNVAVCAADTNEPPRLLNYLTAPNVVVWSAVSCSSAFPGLFKPQDLLAKDQYGNFVRCVLPVTRPLPAPLFSIMRQQLRLNR